MSVVEELMDSFYSNDYGILPAPKGYEVLNVQAYEMRSEVQRLINTKHKVKTGFKSKGHNRSYLVYYKK